MYSPCDADGGFSPGVLVQVQGDKLDVLRRITPLFVHHTLLNSHSQCCRLGRVRDIGVNMCEVSFFGSIIRAYYYVRIASAILKEDRTHARFPRRVGTTAQHPLPGNAAAARLSQRIDHRYQRPLWQALLSLPSAPSTRTWS